MRTVRIVLFAASRLCQHSAELLAAVCPPLSLCSESANELAVAAGLTMTFTTAADVNIALSDRSHLSGSPVGRRLFLILADM